MVTCAVRHCPNNVRNACGRIRFFRFPSDHRRRKLWTEFCDRETPWTPNHNSRVCSDHFDEYQYETRRQDGRKKLSPFAIPTVYSKQIDVCEDFVNENVVEDVIKEEKNVLGMTLEFVSCEDFMYHQCVVWLDHDYCKVWRDNSETTIKSEAIFFKTEPEWISTELEIKKEDLPESPLIETLETVIKEEC